MNISKLSMAATNPFAVNHSKTKRKEETSKKPEQKQPQTGNNSQRQNPSFSKMPDGSFIEKKVDAKSGDQFIVMTKQNWSKKGVLNSTDKTTIPLKTPYIASKESEDFENNTTSKALVTNPLSPADTVYQTVQTERRDLITGKTVARQTYTMSEVPGIYNVTETDALGRKKVITSAKKTPDGGFYISKNMTSLDGTQTTYRYKQDATGNHISMFNQIKDKNGKVLSTVDRTYDRVSDTLATSSVNGRHYTITNEGRITTVTDELTKEKTEINSKDFKMPLYKKPFYGLINVLAHHTPKKSKEPVAQKLMQKLPGDTILNMNKNVRYVVPLKDSLDSAFMSAFGILKSTDDGFVVNHELGHSMDAMTFDETKKILKENANAVKNGEKPKEYVKNPIADNPEFVKEYLGEKALFTKAFPDFQEKFIDYFIFGVPGQTARGRKETVAETNAINSQTPVPPEILAMRTQVLQQYFPRTIAVATKLTTPIAIDDSNNRNNAGDIIIPEKKIIVSHEKAVTK